MYGRWNVATWTSCSGPQESMGLDYRVLRTLGNGEEKEVHLEYRCTTSVQLSHSEHIFQGHLLILLLAAFGLSWRWLKYTPDLQSTTSRERKGGSEYTMDYKNRPGTHLLPFREKIGTMVVPSFPNLVWTKSSYGQRGPGHRGRIGFWLIKYLNAQCICFFSGILLFSKLIEAIVKNKPVFLFPLFQMGSRYYSHSHAVGTSTLRGQLPHLTRCITVMLDFRHELN